MENKLGNGQPVIGCYNEIVNDIDNSELTSAITADKKNKILEWTIAYLQNNHRNEEVLKDIHKRTIIKTLLVEYPLNLLARIMGPQNGEASPEPLPMWLATVTVIQNEIKNHHMPPPIIATDFWEKLYIVDGNHRHEALLKSGVTTYWTIFLLEKGDSEKKIYDSLVEKTSQESSLS